MLRAADRLRQPIAPGLRKAAYFIVEVPGGRMSEGFALDAYLVRIGHTGPIAADLATLSALHAAHVASIPFESLNPLLRLPVELDIAALQHKLIHSRRGGYCFEQTTVFKAALDSIGFSVTALIGRVRWMFPPEAPLGPRTHMLLKVDLPEGPYLADVGFGVCLLDVPMPLVAGREHATAMGKFRLTEADGLFALEILQPAGWRVGYVFDLVPQLPADQMLGNWFTATHPTAIFARMLIMERVTQTQRLKLVNRRFIVEGRDGQVISERELASADELGEVMEEVFGVTPPVPVAEIFVRIA